MMKCLKNFLKMLFSKKEVVLEAPKVIEPQYPNVKILVDNGHGNNTAGKRSPH